MLGLFDCPYYQEDRNIPLILLQKVKIWISKTEIKPKIWKKYF